MSVVITLYQLFGFPLGVGITIVIGYYFLKNPEKFEKWVSMIAWLVSRVYEKADYVATKTEIQSRINSFISALEANTTTTFPRVVLKWTARGSDEIIWEEGRAIIVMRDRQHRNKNLIHAVYLFTSKTLIKKCARHLSQTQKKSLDLFSTKLILEKESKSALEQFMSEFFAPEIDRNGSLRGLIQQYVHIDRIGVFFPILIQELNYLGSKVFLSKPAAEVIGEVKSLTNFLENFSQREVGDMTTPDTFVSRYARCAIRIVASKKVREKGDITWHKERIEHAIGSKCENVYIIGDSAHDNKVFMDEVAEAVLAENDSVERIKSYTFRGQIKIKGVLRNVSTLLIHLHNPNVVKYLYEKNDIESII